MATVGAYEAKTHLPRLLERVAQGETITITRHGRPVAVLAPPPSAPTIDFDDVRRRMAAFRERVGPDAEGWTTKQYVEEGRRV